MGSESELQALMGRILDFRDRRNWKRFHNSKDLALSVSIEASELLELFQWKSEAEVAELVRQNKFLDDARSEIADVLIYLLLLANELEIDLVDAASNKIQINEHRFPA